MKALLDANSVKWSGSWLHALPLPYAGLTISVLEYRTALRFRTGHEVLSSMVVVAFTLQAILTLLAFTNYRVLARVVLFLVTMLFGIAFILWVNRQAFLCKENLSICFKMVRGIYQLIFYLVRCDLCVDVTM
jgi:hypothetical protein